MTQLIVEPLCTSDMLLRQQVDALLAAEGLPHFGSGEAEKPFGLVLLGRRADNVVGAFVGWLVVDELHVLALATASHARRQGVGSALMRNAIGIARARGARRAWLEVRSTNTAAIHLYVQLGFREHAKRVKYYADGTDALELALDL